MQNLKYSGAWGEDARVPLEIRAGTLLALVLCIAAFTMKTGSTNEVEENSMSATQDKTQRTTFVFNNLYQLYKKGAPSPVAVQTAEVSGLQKGKIIKAAEVNLQDPENVQIKTYRPVDLMSKPSDLPRKAEETQAQAAPAALSGLKKNLSDLQDLHSRLKFMLKEIEELTKKS